MARLLLFTGKEVKLLNIDADDLDSFYKALGCDCFDIAYRKVGGKYYDIFCDDEGLFKEDNPITAISSRCERMLVGNLIFANHNEYGETTSLSDEDIDNITENIVNAKTSSGKQFMCVLCE